MHLYLEGREDFLLGAQVLDKVLEIIEFCKTRGHTVELSLFRFGGLLLFNFCSVSILLEAWHCLVKRPCDLQRILPLLVYLNDEVVILSDELLHCLQIVEAKEGH